ncbi:MAG TPA: hypothetical protein VI316_03510 [Candidatus Dormibacteraeota bacterium]
MDRWQVGPDPLVASLKAKQAKRTMATTPAHVASVVIVVAAAALLVVGAWQPWIEPYGIGRAAIKGDDADAAVASLLMAGAVLELIACAVVVWAMRRRGRPPRFLHLVSVPVSVLGLLFWYMRFKVDQDRVTVFNGLPDVPATHLGDGAYLTGAGLAAGVLALLVAIPAMRRVWLS